MAEIKLTLKQVTAQFEQKKVAIKKGEGLTLALESNFLTNGKLLVFFNHKAFLVRDGKVTIPERYLKPINTVLVQDKSQSGHIFKEWRICEKLALDLERLDAQGDKQFVAEREQYKQMLEKFGALTVAVEQMKAQHNADRKAWAEEKQKLARAVIDLSNALADVNATVSAIKNEPLI